MHLRHQIAPALALALALFLSAAWAQAPGAPPPSDEQIRALVARALKNQHQNDLLLKQYSRTEHDRVHASGHGLSDKDTLTRIVPTGTGEAKVELERNGTPTTPAQREDAWKAVTLALSNNSRVDDPEVKKDYERAAKRDHERAELVDAIASAFRYHFVHRENLNGRTVALFTFEPTPGFHTSVRFAGICAKIHGMVWVDENAAQIVRLDAQMFDDYSFVAGIVAKIYRGSRLILDLGEMEPGVWMLTHASVDLEGRRLMFAASLHETIDDRDYRRIGLPREALQSISLEQAADTKKNPASQR